MFLIGGFNFYFGCSNFTEIKVNDDNQVYKAEDNILYSKDGEILYQVPQAKTGELIIPEGVEIIGMHACSSNTRITKIVISSTVKTIRDNAFRDISSLEEVIIGANVTSIGIFGFYNCNKLKTVTIDSETIAKEITTQTSAQNLITVAETIYIKEGITPGSYITNIDNFTKQTSDKPGYIKYIKNS